MAKKMMAALAGVFLFANVAMATLIEVAAPTVRVVSDSQRITEYVYSGPTATHGVAASTTQDFSITVPWYYGRLIRVRFESSSTDADIWIANVTGSSSATDIEVLWAYQGCNLGCASSSDMLPIEYINADTTVAKTLYFIIKNDDGSNATGDWELQLTFQKGGF